MPNKTRKLTFSDTLSEEDYGLIVGKDGVLKGIWVPEFFDHNDVIPENIAKLCADYFNYDPAGDRPATIH